MTEGHRCKRMVRLRTSGYEEGRIGMYFFCFFCLDAQNKIETLSTRADDIVGQVDVWRKRVDELGDELTEKELRSGYGA